MPLFIANGRIPPRWAERNDRQSIVPSELHDNRSGFLRFALINNMPDSALEDTEIQFFDLLSVAANYTPISIKLYSLPGIRRGERGEEHLRNFYSDFSELLNSSVDAIIVTGTEPHSAKLRDEPYWPALTELLEWAERNTCSAILSCLAAHGSVLHKDGIERQPLRQKRCGVFDLNKISDHFLTRNIGEVRFPHSRWNELDAEELRTSGYTIVTESDEAGVDCFAKQREQSLFVHFQGHPEYSSWTLLKEYRRDARRFLAGERETYPSMPRGYFDADCSQLLTAFQTLAMADRRPEVIASFPEIDGAGLHNGWRCCSTSIYRNWLDYVRSNRMGSIKPAFQPCDADQSYAGGSVAS